MFLALTALASALLQEDAAFGRCVEKLSEPPKEERALTLFVEGYSSLQGQRFREAAALFQEAVGHLDTIEDYGAYFLGLTYLRSGAPGKAASALENFGSRFPISLLGPEASTVYAEALTASGDPVKAISFLKESQAAGEPRAALTLGRAYIKAGKASEGARILRSIYYHRPFSPEASAAAEELAALQKRFPLPEAPYCERKARVSALVASGRWQQALPEIRALLASAPRTQETELQFLLGKSLRRTNQRSEAQRALKSLKPATAAQRTEQLYELLEIARAENDLAGVENSLSLLRKHGSNAFLETALFSVANLHLLKGNRGEAIRYWQELERSFPSGERASYAHWKAAWLEFRLGKIPQAKSGFASQVHLYPASPETAAALYWQARIAQRENDFAAARTSCRILAGRFPGHYYTFLAEEILAELGPGQDEVAAGALSQETKARYNPPHPPENNPHLQRSALFRRLGITELAAREAEAASGGRTEWLAYELSQIYTEGAQAHLALQAVNRLIPLRQRANPGALPEFHQKTLFPLPYQSELEGFARSNNLDPHMVAALIRQESGFNPRAVSRADALGLMQVLPATGRAVARELGWNDFERESLLNPRKNLEIGTRYLRRMLDEFGGEPHYAWAAYNAGGSRVKAWLADMPYRDVAEFVEDIPFSETREYVKAVARNAEWYRRIYGNTQARREQVPCIFRMSRCK
jgi:soluble lytic murein transglycosylase